MLMPELRLIALNDPLIEAICRQIVTDARERSRDAQIEGEGLSDHLILYRSCLLLDAEWAAYWKFPADAPIAACAEFLSTIGVLQLTVKDGQVAYRWP